MIGKREDRRPVFSYVFASLQDLLVTQVASVEKTQSHAASLKERAFAAIDV